MAGSVLDKLNELKYLVLMDDYEMSILVIEDIKEVLGYADA